MISAVIDPSVLVSAFIGDTTAGPGQVLTAWKEQRFSLVVSPLLLAELVSVDKDLLELEIEGLTICRPVAFVERLDQT